MKEPDRFTGRDPSKFPEWLAQNVLNFNAAPAYFADDAMKINFASSYLTDVASAWYQPYLVAQPQPEICRNWTLFISELNANFGDPHINHTARTALRRLEMKTEWRIALYNVEFNKLAPHTGYNDVALNEEYYRGLPERIKIRMSYVGRPETLRGTRELATRADFNYWEFQETKKTGTSGSSNAPRSGNTSSQTQRSAPANTGSNTGAGNARRNGQLDSSGHITEAERQRRMRENLCIYCGQSGHAWATCPDRLAGGRRNNVVTTTTTVAPAAAPTVPAPPAGRPPASRTGRSTFTFTTQPADATSNSETAPSATTPNAAPSASIEEVPSSGN